MSFSKYPRLRFFLVNLLKGLVAFACRAYILLLSYLQGQSGILIEKFYAKPGQITDCTSFPNFSSGCFPELFMVWALHKGSLLMYVLHVFFLQVSPWEQDLHLFLENT